MRTPHKLRPPGSRKPQTINNDDTTNQLLKMPATTNPQFTHTNSQLQSTTTSQSSQIQSLQSSQSSQPLHNNVNLNPNSNTSVVVLPHAFGHLHMSGTPSMCTSAMLNDMEKTCPWELVDGTITERDDNLRAAYGVQPGATIMNYLTVKHHAIPIEDKATIISIEGPPRKPRRSQAGRKPRRRPGIRRSFRKPVCVHCKQAGTIEIDTFHAELVCTQCGAMNGKSDAQFNFHDQEHMEKVTTTTQASAAGQSYDNANHFRDTLLQVQGIEPMKLDPPDLLDKMRDYMTENCIERSTLTPSGTYKILKNMGLTTLYKHKVKITYLLSGNPPKTLDVDQVEKLCLDFQKIQAPMRRAMRRKLRKNIPSYMFILFKLCEMYQLHEVCNVCYLLKTNCKLNKLDDIWHDVCEELKSEGFEFIPSPTFNSHYK